MAMSGVVRLIPIEAAQAGREDSLGCCTIAVWRDMHDLVDCSHGRVLNPVQRTRYAVPGKHPQQVEHVALDRHGERYDMI